MNSSNEKLVTGSSTILISGIVVWIACAFSTHAQGPAMSNVAASPSTTWRRNRTDVKYVGAQACLKCHAEEAASQHATAMGTALQPAATSEVLRSNPRL